MRQILFFLLSSCFLYCSCYANLESMVQQNIQKGQGIVQNEYAGNIIPSYSRESATRIASEMEGKSDGDFNDGKMDPDIAVMMHRQKDDSLAGHSMFDRAEELLENPIGIEALNKDDCKTRVNEQKNHYSKRIVKVQKTATVIEKKTCEKPNLRIMCEKSLHIECEEKGVCDVVKEVFAAGIDQSFTITSTGLELKFTSVLGAVCVKKEWVTTFNIKNLQHFTEFRLSDIIEDNILHLELNGQIIYNGLNGRYLEILPAKGMWWWKDQAHEIQVSNGAGAIKTCGYNSGQGTHNWRKANFDVLAAGYLKEGVNKLRIQLVAYSVGTAGVRFAVKKECCKKIKEEWQEKCWLE